ncbi:hypothetical protein E4T38_08798 [Aureobasidium subglaciale]|nr:hypothetical protein E4T38_08798 [Aureobasidium subglaciale]KAI5214861.1 hypothetical protein E4T40_08755 [Aureobasidium subglaciale]KAI5217841.1 hypothetical protein E4T41_08665 [Aureobasidium subglaciale]KAI5255421.1 hypothetical protein E4T46_08699 [Aureobasidium subglaciale]
MTGQDVTLNDDRESDYGSEFGTDDEATLSVLLAQAASQPLAIGNHAGVLPGTPPLSPFARGTRRKYVDDEGIVFEMVSRDGPVDEASIEIEYDEHNRSAFSPRLDANRVSVPPEADTGPEQPNPLDTRSPIERFRTPPKKPLSVTDIISPAWCELQYWYSLTKYGRVRRTAAMKQGSSVHKVLEEQAATVLPVGTIRLLVERILQEELKAIVPAETIQQVVQKALDQEKRTSVPLDVVGGLVHQVLEKGELEPVAVNTVSESVHKVTGAQVQKAVSVEIETKEDAFGLKIWNTIQNLRTLRSTGTAREFETWAIIEGQVVNGIIDELSYVCPDEDFEAEVAQQKETKPKRGRPKKQKVVPESQTLDAFFGGSQNLENDNTAWLGNPHADRRIYIKDVKTRGSKSMPKGEASFRPTSMQLMMYHRMLSLLASNSVPAEQVFTRYGLDSGIPFSDMFIAQLGSIESGTTIESDDMPARDAVDELLAHNSLEKLWTLMISEFQLTITFPNKPSAPSPIGDVLMAEYRASGSGSIIGSKTFAYDVDVLDAYLKKTMAWWNGERMPKGVEIEEAFKCRMCEFAEVCTWRKDKVEEGVRKARLRNQVKQKSDV